MQISSFPPFSSYFLCISSFSFNPYPLDIRGQSASSDEEHLWAYVI